MAEALARMNRKTVSEAKLAATEMHARFAQPLNDLMAQLEYQSRALQTISEQLAELAELAARE